ncbi:UDP-sugar transporter sqv-7 [Diplonema papillatum]|nr:UDP-sugar transporter sqv-7 [Diplonema papillatum]
MAAMDSLLNFSLFLCASVNSPLTTTVVGVMKAVVTTGLGFFVLGGARVTTVNFSGIVVNTAGGCLYTWAKYVSKAEKNAPT